MKLLKCQLKALGCVDPAELPNWLISPQLLKLYEPCPKENLELDDEGQSYPEFMEMVKRPPNEQGTGRLKFKQVDRFSLTMAPKNKPLKSRSINIICEVLSAYLTIRTSFKEQKWKLSASGIVDRLRREEFILEHTDGQLEVQPLLGLLIEFKEERKNTVLLVENSLCEEGSGLDGRACGDGVAAVSYCFKSVEHQYKLQDLIETVVHESLHTLGFDHCLAWRCVMNGVVGQEIWPCPACMLKLTSELTISASQWYRQLIAVFSKYNLNRFLRKGQAIMNLIQKD